MIQFQDKVDPTQTPGGQLPLVAAGPPAWATLLPPPLAQADMAEPSTMVAQMPIAAGTLVMMLALLFCGNRIQVNRLCDGGVRRWRFTTS